MKKDLTRGNVPGHLIRLAVPTMAGFMAQTLYDLVDMAWIGRISSEAVAGVTIFTTVFWIVEVLNEIIGNSSVSLISQSYGAGNRERTEQAIEQTLTFKALVALLAAALLFMFIKPLMAFFTEDRLVLKMALDYGYLRIFFLPFMFSSFTVNTALRCTGDVRTPMIIMIISSILNIVLDPFFMFETIPGTSIPGLNMGIFGASLATVISTTAAFLGGFIFLFSSGGGVKPKLKGLLKLRWDIDYKLLTIGLPIGLETFSRQFSLFLIMKFAALYGTASLAAFGIGNRLYGFIFLPLIGLFMGGSTVVGQNLGADRVDRAVSASKWSALFSTIMMIFFMAVAQIFPSSIMSFFISDSDVIGTGVEMIRLISISFIPMGSTFGLAIAFSGSGHNMPFLLSGIVSKWVVQLPFLLAGWFIFHWPVSTIWISFILADVVSAFFIAGAYGRGKWKEIRV
ncbi:MATE family efflux transporter [Spirochaeta isovalerica]|uniref:Putative MATE family efflux protein n=1 Tax=Spirochaeta isovalerica TaxID=150 RepID=A0A841R8R4_9SPIO|nr:MATE family efflux transporter [Spirochaeta isovalerica]MBB6479349.1 putative MATE family efflux protein [Spirochaeta isovalerica]